MPDVRAITWNVFHGRDDPPDHGLVTWRSRLLRVTERNATHAQVNRPLLHELLRGVVGPAAERCNFWPAPSFCLRDDCEREYRRQQRGHHKNPRQWVDLPDHSAEHRRSDTCSDELQCFSGHVIHCGSGRLTGFQIRRDIWTGELTGSQACRRASKIRPIPKS